MAVKHKIKIENAQEASGTIDLQRLTYLAEGFKKIAEKTLQIRLRGVSSSKIRKKSFLKKALKIYFTGIKKGSTLLTFEDEKLEKTLDNYQLEIFQQESEQDLLQQTPITLFIQSFHEAMDHKSQHNFLDKSLLKELKLFQRIFLNENESLFIFSEQGSTPKLKLEKKDFDKIKILEEKTPDPKPIILNGILDELKYSKLKVRIQTKEGIVDAFLPDSLTTNDIATYWGKNVTIIGTAHFKPSGRSVIEIEQIYPSQEGDKYFSKKPTVSTVNDQIQQQIRRKKSNPLLDITGKWPGPEDFEQLQNMLSK